MNDTRFSINTRATLERAGWTPERRIDTAMYEKAWEERGLPRYQCAIDFLASFGGLQGKWPWAESYRDFDFDALEAAGDYMSEPMASMPESMASWNEIAEDSLVLIGYISGGPQFVLMDSKGAFYGAFTDNELNLLGDTTEEFLERLCGRLTYG